MPSRGIQGLRKYGRQLMSTAMSGTSVERVFEPALADEAPRTDHVGDDVDMQRSGRGGRSGHDETFDCVASELSACSGRREPTSPRFGRKWCGAQPAATSPTTRAISESTLSVGLSVASVTAVSTPLRLRSGASIVCLSTRGDPPRDDMRGAQVGFGEHREDRIVGLAAGEIDLAHQPADQPGGVEADAAIAAARRKSARSTSRRRAFPRRRRRG